MKAAILSKEEIYVLVSNNIYKIDPEKKFLSRCIDDRYQNDLNVSSLAIPGADAGELAVMFATANAYGFEIIGERAYQILAEVVGGIHNLRFHTDNKHESDPLAGCGHFSLLRKNPDVYNLKKDQVDFIEIKVKNSIILGAEDEVLFGEHLRGAILQIRGDYGIYPAYAIDTNTGKKRAEFFEFHETLVENRHRILAAKLVKDKAVKLYEGCDEEYLYEALSETTDRHFYETLKQLGKDLSIYQIDFDENGDFKVIDLTNISS